MGKNSFNKGIKTTVDYQDLYAFVSQVNQNIVRVEDEKELFRNACQTAIQFGKFKIAWIGLFDDLNKKITLVDQCGIPAKDIKLFKDAPFQANGPQGHVLRTGVHYICNDIPNNLELESWKPIAAAYGVRSCIVLPIKKAGVIAGTLNLYAKKVSFSDEEEIELLVQVSEDISFALDLFEKEKVYQRTKELMVQNESRFRVLIEKSTDMLLLSTEYGEMLYGSPSITSVFGYSLEEFKNKAATEFIHPDDISAFIANRIEISKIPGASTSYEQRLLHKNGNWIWCEGTDTNMLHEPGIHAMVSNFRDISEKKRTEQKQAFDSNNLNALINNTNDRMWSVDKDLNLITSNSAFDRMIKYLTGKTIKKGSSVLSTGFPKEQLARFKKCYARAFEGESFTEIEHNTSPVEFWAEVSYCPIREGDEVIGTACYSHDITERKKVDENLLESEKQYRRIVETAQEGIWMLDEQGRTVFVNKKMCEIMEYTEAEMLGRTNLSFKDPDEQKIAQQQAARRKQGIAETNEAKFITKSGRNIVMHVSTNPIIGEDGTYIGALGMMTDITENKKIEQQLGHSESRLKEAQAIAHLGHWELNFATQEALWSEEACRIYGLAPDDTRQTYEVWLSFVHPEDLAYVLEKTKPSGSFDDIELDHRILLRDGTVKHLYSWSKFEFDKEEKPIGLYGIAYDITERKIAEANLIESELRLMEAQSIAHLGNFEVDIDRGAEIWSDGMYNIYGLDKEGVVPSKELFLSFIHPDDLGDVKAALYNCLKTFENSVSEFRFIRTDGTLRYGYSEARFEFDRDKNPVRVFGIMQDVTERKLAEIERTKIVNDLVNRNKDLEQFAYIISHNLRAPLANIIGASAVLNDPDLDAGDKETLSRGINESVIKLDGVVKDMNHILQVKGEINAIKERVRFSDLVEDIKISIGNMIQTGHIAIKCDFFEVNELFTLKPYLYSIFYNLISNSIKYRRSDVQSLIWIKSRKGDGKIILTFTDNGLGIDMDKKGDLVFGLYKRFHHHIEGKGVGLYMVKTQVEALGGKISISSKVDEGTEFVIEFEE